VLDANCIYSPNKRTDMPRIGLMGPLGPIRMSTHKSYRSHRSYPLLGLFAVSFCYLLSTSNAFLTLSARRIRSPRFTLGEPLKYAYSMLTFFDESFLQISDNDPG
jgi:hypothetical protein